MENEQEIPRNDAAESSTLIPPDEEQHQQENQISRERRRLRRERGVVEEKEELSFKDWIPALIVGSIFMGIVVFVFSRVK